MVSPTFTLPEASNGGPLRIVRKREAKSDQGEVLIAMAGAVLIATKPWTVDFMITGSARMHIEMRQPGSFGGETPWRRPQTASPATGSFWARLPS